MIALKVVLLAAFGYLTGSVQWGIIIAKWFGLKDIRKVGSGGTGATNVMRNLGWLPSLITLFLDALKGAAAALIGIYILGENGGYICSAAALAGHVWPLYYGFKGGKGVATALGAVLAVNPLVGLVVLIVGVAFIAVIRIVSIASVIFTFLYMVYTFIFRWGNVGLMCFSAIIFLLILYCHRANIGRIIRGEEKKLDFSKKLVKRNETNSCG